jgi:hypothetical protein
MDHGVLIAKKLAQTLNSTGHTCTQEENRVTLADWGALITVLPNGHDDKGNSFSLTATILLIHPSFPRGAIQELAVGWGKTKEEAVDAITTSWMLTFLPGVKFLLEEKPHDCSVTEEDVSLQNVPAESYRLILGPLQHAVYGQEPAHEPEGFHQRLLWNAVSSLLLKELGPGVSHVRIFAGRIKHDVEGDVFMNGVKWQEATVALQRAIAGFPIAGAPSVGYGLKQHLFIRPVDLARGAQQRKAFTHEKWMKALAARPDLVNNATTTAVLRTLNVMSGIGTEAQYEAALVDEGMSRELAQRLVTFVPSAAIRTIYPDLQYAQTYFWTNDRTDLAVEKRYDQTPEFLIALETFKTLCAQGTAADEVAGAAAVSAELGSINQARAKEIDLSTLSFKYMIHMTSEPVEGNPLTGLLKEIENNDTTGAGKRPWWKFW